MVNGKAKKIDLLILKDMSNLIFTNTFFPATELRFLINIFLINIFLVNVYIYFLYIYRDWIHVFKENYNVKFILKKF